MASQASPTTNRKAAWELDSINTDEKTPLLANTQSAEAPTSSRVSPQTTTLTTIPSRSYLKYSDDEDESALLLSAEATAVENGYFDALVANHEAAEADYESLILKIEQSPNGNAFIQKIDKPLFKKMFIEFFSKNPGFNPNQEIQIEQSSKFDVSRNYASNKLTVGNFKYKVHRYANDSVFEGTFNPATRQLTQGKKTFTKGKIHEGTFDPATSWLTEGKKTFTDGQIHAGTFALNADGKRYLAEGKITYADRRTKEGTFAVCANGKNIYLSEGKKTSPDGQIHAGTFDPATKQLTQGKRTDTNGDTYEGTFDPATGRLTQGKVTLAVADGQIYEGTFALHAYRTIYLAEGKKTFTDGRTEEGTFDPKTGLTKGKKTSPDGQIHAGTFDAEGKCTPSNALEVIAAARQAVETANTIVQTLRGKYHY